ncbi:ArsR/SmtB family transcription factor [Actinoplanes siamensis]|uniref:ArsR/SmtB family transcription factor n=1 Tax=Actinoplanes siamensis TaxID=1223317 RepID=UPI001941C7EA|nr:metalloregulator ArsR/SmtB family transcription factor [Actinoplanes siamensis]
MDVLEVIAEPARRRIVAALLTREASVGDLVAALGMSQPAVSKHLRVLREAGVVSVRARAQLRIYRLEAGPFRELDDWLRPYRRLWGGHLDAIERHLADTSAASAAAEPSASSTPAPPDSAGPAPAPAGPAPAPAGPAPTPDRPAPTPDRPAATSAGLVPTIPAAPAPTASSAPAPSVAEESS